MAGTAAIITATTARAPSTAATTHPVPTGARKPGTARRSSAAARKYAGTISNHANGLNGSAFIRRASTAMGRGGIRAPMAIEARLRGRAISISGIGERPKEFVLQDLAAANVIGGLRVRWLTAEFR